MIPAVPAADQNRTRVFCGTVVHATDTCPLQVLENSALGVTDGKVVFLESKERLDDLLGKHELKPECVTYLTPRQWVMPGLVDCHLHSPQLPIQALGTDLGLLDWLATYTFPAEARYADHCMARAAHRAMVKRTLGGGTTLASYFSSIHADTSLYLCQAAEEQGQRALVGKCCMDMSAPDFYRETTQQSLEDTNRFVKEVLSLKLSLVTPVITPRFAVSCSEELMRELGHIARSHNLPIQTHMSESLQETDTVLQQFPGHQSYAHLYDHVGLLGSKTILAHCVHVSDKELDLLIERDCGVVHCACSNFTLRSGVMDIRRQLDRGVKMGLGTDVGAGYTTSMLAAMRQSVDASNARAIQHDQRYTACGEASEVNGRRGQSPKEAYRPLTMDEAFRLATLGGSRVLGQNCGNFEVGREFDALLVDPEVKDSPLDLFPFDSVKDVVHKFLYYGDDRNMVKIYVQGRQVVDRTG
ncbi:guanine deaminase-like [Babylonia areolata]|uniref:guanine deaminase-like n=1 Tax=Babylonia areolata TaxID=304850 RepID=UPI003FD37BE0